MDKKYMTEAEFNQMVERLRPRLMQMGREFFGSSTEAEEVVQETWLRAWGVAGRVELTDAYILRIARNVCVSLWRGQRLQINMAADALAENLSADVVTPQEELEERENSEWLQSRLLRLYSQWDKRREASQVVGQLNAFEQVEASIEGDAIVIH